jgi:hypothetical protein
MSHQLPIQDVPGLGRDGEVLEVKPGRARNHLVPARVAVYATPDRLPEAAERRAAWADESAIAEQTDEDGDLAVRDVCYVFPFSTKGLFARKAGRRRSSKRRVAFFFSDAFGTKAESGFCLSASPGWFFFSSRGSFFFATKLARETNSRGDE